MNNKKIALIDPVGMKAGMDFYNVSLLKNMARLGYETWLFSNFHSEVQGVHIKHSFNNIGVPKVLAIFNNFIYFISAVRFCKKAGVSWLILHLFRGGLFDLVTIGLARVMGLRILLIVHDVKSLDKIVLPFTRRFILKHFNHSKMVHNRFSYDQLSLEINGSMGNVHIIPHGNYTELAEGDHTGRPVSGFTPVKDRRYLLFFGQLKKVKGLDILINALGMADTSFHLVIAGRESDDTFSAYRQMIIQQGLGDRVILLNRFISNVERDALLRLCEAVVLPYRKVYQSGVLLMAMSYSKTVIVSDLPPNREVISDQENGLLFTSGDPRSLAAVLENLYHRRYDSASMQVRALQSVQAANSWSDIASRYARILET